MTLKNAAKKQALVWIFLSPAIALFVIFRGWPLVSSFILSFFEVNIITKNVYVGLKNYLDLLNDAKYIRSVLITVKFTVVIVPLTLLCAMLISLVLDSRLIRFSGFFKALFFMPFVTSWVVISIIWKWFLNAKYGLVNYVLSFLSIRPQNWLSEPALALWAIIFVSLWKLGGYFILIFVANLQMIDPSLFEAAEADGANAFQKFFYITIHQLKPAIFVSATTATVFYFRTFVVIFAMTGGDPLGSTDLLAYHTYNLAFQSYRFGQANASIVCMFLFVAVALLFQMVFFEKGKR